MVNRTNLNLTTMELVEAISKNLKTTSWIWGGFTVDIYENRILREHDDIDYLTLNLHHLIPQFTELFTNCGWQANILENGDLKLQQDSLRIHLGHVEVSGSSRWMHNSEEGSLWFPPGWLKWSPVSFCGLEVHVVEPEFQFVMFERPQMLNPNWKPRDKDILARQYLRKIIESKGITSLSLFEQVSEHEPQSSGTRRYP